MLLVNDSITIVLLGDWNKLYIQPEWVARNVFEHPEMELGVESRGIEFHVTYKKNNVTINPSQDKVVFTASNVDQETLQFLAKCVNNYLEKATTPQLVAYGFNADYADSQTDVLANVFDSLSDTMPLFEMGFEIGSTEVSRKLIKDGRIINMNCSLVGKTTNIHFNEHHEINNSSSVCITAEKIKEFISLTGDILLKLGYEFGGEED